MLNTEAIPVENAINIYTDGSSLSHPRAGGIGIRLVIIDSLGKEIVDDILLPGYSGATNNQMELRACIDGIKGAMHHPAFNNYKHVYIHTDSQYVVDNHKRALYLWSKNKWCNHEGKPVSNAELWKELLRTTTKCRKWVELKWVKGHAKN